MYSFQTLHDFVSNLLNDEIAKAAYAADPLGALADAGLGDLTPQDVEEVIPLVTDALPTDLPLVEDLVDLDVDTLTGDATGASVIAEVEDLAYGGVVASHDGDDTDLWAGAQSVAGRVAGVVQTDDGLVSGGLSTPLVFAGANSHGDYLVTTADPAELLDDLGDGTSSAAATATTLIGTGAGALTDSIDHGSDTLAGFLAGTPASPVSEVVENGADTLNEAIVNGADHATGALDHLPSVDDLPTDDLPVDLPDVPDIEGNLGDLPHVGDLDLPAQLPDLPVELPDLGVDTSSVNDLVSSSPVADIVGNSGVTDTVSDVTGKLPVVGDVTDDLNLGL